MQKILALYTLLALLPISSFAAIQTDVLFSWQKLPDVLSWAATNPKTNLFLSNYLYAWRTPTATFAYGDLPIRIKLKKNVNFVEIDRAQRDCRNFSKEENEHSVYYSWLGKPTMDYLLCSPKVMHSWSYGTLEGLIEIKNEYTTVQRDQTKADLYASDYDPNSCADCIFGNLGDQRVNEWKKQALDEKISFLEAISGPEFGRVFCLEDTSDCTNDHFSLANSTIFGPVAVEHAYSHSSPKPIQSNKTLYIDGALLNSDKYGANKILESLKTIKLTNDPTKSTLGCISVSSSECNSNYGLLFGEDQDYLNESEDKPSEFLLGYLTRALYAMKVYKFSEKAGNLYRKIAIKTSLNELSRKRLFSGWTYYRWAEGSCLESDLFRPDLPSRKVSGVLCDINL